MVDLATAKDFLRVEHNADDKLIELYIDSAKEYVTSACGNNVDFTKKRTETIVLMLVSDYYETRTAYGKGAYSHNVSSMLTQLRLETEADS